MENRIVIPNRGMLEIKDSNIKCFLGKDNNCKSSEQLWNELKVQEPIVSQETYKLGEEEYIIHYPIQEKQISVVTKNGKSYNSTIYFIDDIKNIISGLKMINPCYIFKGEYKPLNSEMYYFHFLYLEEENEIKDVDINSIKFDELENTYKNIEIKKTQILGEINKNIFVYSKIDDIDKENYYITLSRKRLSSELNMFYESKERDRVSDLIFGMYGNYASGKSFFLIYFNYFYKHPSVYLNLKALKKAFKTEGFQNILNNELMFLFYKLKKSFNDFKNFVNKFLPFEKQEFENLIISIIKEIKDESVLIILDQYQENIYSNFVMNLKKILFSQNSKIKVIICSSINDGSIRETYLNNILNRINFKTENEESNNKNNNYIPFLFIKKLVDNEQMKLYIKKTNIQNNKDFNNALELFDFLPTYYSLCKHNIKDLKSFIEKTKEKISNKILKFNQKENFDIKFFDNIRIMIDNEITFDDIMHYSKYIPFKYFFIEQNKTSLILRTHFPLIKVIYNQIILNENINLINGNIKYDKNFIGSILQLNIILDIKNKIIPLDIDSFIKVDSIFNFNTIIEKDTNDFKNKNIFITQKNENAKYFDIAFIKGKNEANPLLNFIQVKKGMSDNKLDKKQMYKIFEEYKNNFFELFHFIPEEENINLIYISLINNEIKQVILSHKRIAYLEAKYNEFKKLYDFCIQNNIQIFFYELKDHLIYAKNINNFVVSELDFSKKDKNILTYKFDTSSLSNQIEFNTKACEKINKNYQNFLRNKRKKPFSYKIKEIDFDFKIIFEFAKKYFIEVKIEHYLDLRKAHIDTDYRNLLENQAIICLKINEKNKYIIDSFIYNEHLIKCEDEHLEITDNIYLDNLDSDNDLLVRINFSDISESFKHWLKNN